MTIQDIHPRKENKLSEKDGCYSIEKMASSEYQHLTEADEIEKKIERYIQSTAVLMPIFSYLHNFLRMKFGWYYRWHLRRNIVFYHWLICAIFILLFVLALVRYI